MSRFCAEDRLQIECIVRSFIAVCFHSLKLVLAQYIMSPYRAHLTIWFCTGLLDSDSVIHVEYVGTWI